MIRIIEEGEAIDQVCKTQRVWALVYKDDEAFAVYYAEWPLESRTPVVLDIILGLWGEGTSVTDRSLTTVMYRGSPPSFMVVEGADRLPIYKSLAKLAFSREAVLNSSTMKQNIFDLLDEIWIKDKRIPWHSDAIS